MNKLLKSNLVILLILVVLGQILFYVYSPKYITPYFENKIFATTGVKHDASDLHKLNESAHYFGETIIGWTKFPNFTKDLITEVKLPEETIFTASIQERQNMVYTIKTPTEIEMEQLKKIKEYIQSQINKYNSQTNTQFLLTNIDYSQTEVSNHYVIGLLVSLIISLFLWAGVIIIKREI